MLDVERRQRRQALLGLGSVNDMLGHHLWRPGLPRQYASQNRGDLHGQVAGALGPDLAVIDEPWIAAGIGVEFTGGDINAKATLGAHEEHLAARSLDNKGRRFAVDILEIRDDLIKDVLAPQGPPGRPREPGVPGPVFREIEQAVLVQYVDNA